MKIDHFNTYSGRANIIHGVSKEEDGDEADDE